MRGIFEELMFVNTRQMGLYRRQLKLIMTFGCRGLFFVNSLHDRDTLSIDWPV